MEPSAVNWILGYIICMRTDTWGAPAVVCRRAGDTEVAVPRDRLWPSTPCTCMGLGGACRVASPPSRWASPRTAGTPRRGSCSFQPILGGCLPLPWWLSFPLQQRCCFSEENEFSYKRIIFFCLYISSHLSTGGSERIQKPLKTDSNEVMSGVFFLVSY